MLYHLLLFCDFSRLFRWGGKYSFEKWNSYFANISICHYRSPGGCSIAKTWRRSYIVKGMTFLQDFQARHQGWFSTIRQTWIVNVSKLFHLLKRDVFYSFLTQPTNIQQHSWKNPTGENDTFKLLLFFFS